MNRRSRLGRRYRYIAYDEGKKSPRKSKKIIQGAVTYDERLESNGYAAMAAPLPGQNLPCRQPGYGN